MKPRRKPGAERKRLESRLFRALLRLKTVGECRAFFLDLCTPAEVELLCDRWEVVGLLLEKQSYRAISARTGASPVTVGRVARALRGPNAGYRRVLERMGEWKD